MLVTSDCSRSWGDGDAAVTGRRVGSLAGAGASAVMGCERAGYAGYHDSSDDEQGSLANETVLAKQTVPVGDVTAGRGGGFVKKSIFLVQSHE